MTIGIASKSFRRPAVSNSVESHGKQFVLENSSWNSLNEPRTLPQFQFARCRSTALICLPNWSNNRNATEEMLSHSKDMETYYMIALALDTFVAHEFAIELWVCCKHCQRHGFHSSCIIENQPYGDVVQPMEYLWWEGRFETYQHICHIAKPHWYAHSFTNSLAHNNNIISSPQQHYLHSNIICNDW